MSKPTEQPSKQTDQDIIDLVFKEKKLYEEATQSWRKEAKHIWNAYNGIMDDRVYPWKSKRFIPKMRTEISYIVPFIFSGHPELEITGIGDEDKAIAGYVEKIENYRLENDLEAFDVVSKWVGQGALLGTSVIKTCWEFETKKKDGYEVPTKDQPKWEVPNILDIFLNPLRASIADQPSVIERVSMTEDEIKAVAHFNDNKKKVKAKSNQSTNTYDSTSLESADIDSADELNVGSKIVDVYERWTTDRIITVADGNERLILRDSPNPYSFIPYERFVFEEDPIPNRFYGRGIGNNSKDLQALFYDIFNEIVDNMHLVANKMFKVKRGAGIDPNQLVAKPGGFIEVDNMDDVEEMKLADIKQSIFEILSRLDDEHKRATGATDLVQGSASNKTLGQDQMAQSNASSRFDLVRRRLKNALAKLAKKTLLMEIENMQDIQSPILKLWPEESREEIFSLIKSIAPEIIFNIRVKGDTILTTNKDVVSKQLIDLLNLAGGAMTPTEFRKNVREIMRLRGIQNIDDLLAEEPPQEMMPQQAMQPEMMPGMEEQNTPLGIQQAI